MKLKNQKRIAAKVLKSGKNRVRFDPERLADVKEAITRADIRALVIDNAIKSPPKRGVSRSRARKIILQKRKGRKTGSGSRTGKSTSRLTDKQKWMNHVRKQREFVQQLRDKQLISTKVYRDIYRKVKGGFFRSKNHVKLYLTENRLFKDGKK